MHGQGADRPRCTMCSAEVLCLLLEHGTNVEAMGASGDPVDLTKLGKFCRQTKS